MELNKKDKDLVNRIRKDIFDLIKKSYNIKNIDNYNNIYADIMGYIDLLTFLNIETDDIFKYISETRRDNTFECIIKHYTESEKNLDFDKKIISNLSDILFDSDYFHGYFQNMETEITDQQMLEMTFDFFDNFKPVISNQLLNMLNENRVIIGTDMDIEHNGAMCCSTFIFSPYIIISPLSNIFDVVTLIHEMGHVYHYQKLQRIKYKRMYNTIYNNQLEVYSHYLELLSYDYLSSSFNSTDVLKLKRGMIKNLIQFYMLLEINLMEFDKVHYIDNYSEYSEYYKYARGILLAFEFYDMYLSDKEKAEYNMEQFLDESGKYDFLTMINKYGLNREHLESGKSIKKYVKEIF